MVLISLTGKTRLLESGSLEESNYTFIWKGNNTGCVRQHGVGFAIKNNLFRDVVVLEGSNERLLAIRLSNSIESPVILSLYAPTLMSSDEVKDQFYQYLHSFIKNIPEKTPLILLGDFNARVGDNRAAWPACLGNFGVGKLNENGQRLLELCSYFKLCCSLRNRPLSGLQSTKNCAKAKTKNQTSPSSEDWFEEKFEKLLPVIEKKHTALLAYKTRATRHNLASLRLARADVQRVVRQCTNEYWEEFSAQIQQVADTGHLKGMYEGIRKAIGPVQKKTAQIKDRNGNVIIDQKKQMDRWVEHYSEVYQTKMPVSQEELKNVQNLPTMLELDAYPTMDEVRSAVKQLSSGKAPGDDGIPTEIIKAGGLTLIHHLHELISLCWSLGKLPQDFKNASIVTLYKNKGDRRCCDNYRGISLFNICGKVFGKVVLQRLLPLAERVYPESQCSFRFGRSTIDMIFSIRQLEIGCPPTLLNIIRSFHQGMQATVKYNGAVSDSFEVESGTKQGDVLAPLLFGIYFAVVLQRAFEPNLMEGVLLHYDACFCSHSPNGLQLLLDKYSCACEHFGLTISVKKTKILPFKTTGQNNFTVNNFLLENRRLRWLGHVRRMDDTRTPKVMLYGELANCKRSKGRPLLRFKDACKRDLKAMDINVNTWEKKADNRKSWKDCIKVGLVHSEERYRMENEERYLKRKSRSATGTHTESLEN
ncbi:uncharacterized protein [Antedon mediterranea]|uniref:uncharacterized protein n=1 Tax=Antedon mediterranea TaxID=105859 RepID=UPI003AF95878